MYILNGPESAENTMQLAFIPRLAAWHIKAADEDSCGIDLSPPIPNENRARVGGALPGLGKHVEFGLCRGVDDPSNPLTKQAVGVW